MNDFSGLVELYTAHIPVSNSLIAEMEPTEFVAEILRLFRDYARQHGREMVNGYLRIERGAVYAGGSPRESYVFLQGMETIEVTASCREVGT